MIWSQLSTTPVLPLGGGSNATQTFAVRGPDPTETLVDIDGHYVNNGNTGDFDLSLIDPAALQDVQIVYGISPSSLIGPNTIGGGINIVTLQPTMTPHALVRMFGGSYGTYGGTVQATGTADGLGYAFSFHGTSSDGSVNQNILAPSVNPPSDDLTTQSVGSAAFGNSILTKLRYQLGGPNGYGYLQFNFRNQNISKDESALLTTYTPPGFSGSGGDDARSRGLSPQDDDDEPTSPYQSFAGTFLQAHNANYGFDAQVPLGNQLEDGAPATVALFSHMTTLSAQSVVGPGETTLPYLYNQRDLLGDDWLEIDHHFSNGTLSFKYDLGTETLDTNFVQGQVTAEARGGVGAAVRSKSRPMPRSRRCRPSLFRKSNAMPFCAITASRRASCISRSQPTTATTAVSERASIRARASSGLLPVTRRCALRSERRFKPRSSRNSSFHRPEDRVPIGGSHFHRQSGFAAGPRYRLRHRRRADLRFAQASVQDLGRFLSNQPPLAREPTRGRSGAALPDQTQSHAVPAQLSGQRRQCRLSRHRTERRLFAFVLRASARGMERRQLLSHGGSREHPRRNAGHRRADARATVAQSLFAYEQSPPAGLAYGARLNWEGFYNELNRSPYATLDAHVSYRYNGYEFGLYGTNLTNVYANPFTDRRRGRSLWNVTRRADDYA